MIADNPGDKFCVVEDVRSIKEEIIDEPVKFFTLPTSDSKDDISGKGSKGKIIKQTRKIKRRKRRKVLKREAQSMRRESSHFVKNIYHDIKNLRNPLNKSQSADNKANYAYHCDTCNVTFPKPHRKMLSCCSSCREKLVCECRGCGKRYESYTSVYRHAKFCSSLAEPFVVRDAAPSRRPDSDGNKESRRATLRSSKDKAFAFKQECVEGEVKLQKHSQRYSPTSLMKFYCLNCDQSFNKILGQRQTDCKKCGEQLNYQCIQCSFIYTSYGGLYYHLQTCVDIQKPKA